MSTTLAIVEDDPSIREILERWFSHSEEFSCIGLCESAERALEILPKLRPEIVLTDINLPGMSGIECVNALKVQLPGTHFLMLTVYEDADHIFEALAAGAVGYLLKRSSRDELVSALKEIKAGGSPMTSDIARKVVQSFQHPTPSGANSELSPRETEVLGMLASGYLYKEIADSLAISKSSVNTYVRRIYEKLHVHRRAEAVALYGQPHRWSPKRTSGNAPTGSAPKRVP